MASGPFHRRLSFTILIVLIGSAAPGQSDAAWAASAGSTTESVSKPRAEDDTEDTGKGDQAEDRKVGTAPPEGEAPKGSFLDRFRDPEDGKLDIMAGSEGVGGLLPIAIPFNEPTLGAGLIVGLGYFHPAGDPPAARDSPSRPVLPTTTFAAAAYSSNGSWVGAGGHTRSWLDGRIRYAGLIGLSSINLDFYGIGGEDQNDDATRFTIDGWGTVQRGEFALGDSPFSAGAKYSWTEADVEFAAAEDLDLGSITNAGLSLFLNFDTRDTTFTPNRGSRASMAVTRYADWLGGDFDYDAFDLAGYHYWQTAGDRLTVGLRAEYHSAGDEAPFYALPWVKLRGVPVLRYLGNHVVDFEIEPRWRIDARWSVLAFAGGGRAAAEIDELDEADKAYNYGVGFRYLLARKLGLGAGIDIARGPEETAAYIVIGNSWSF